MICNLIILLLLLPHRMRLRHSLRQKRSFSKAENKKVFCLSLWNTWKLYLCVCVSCVCYHILLSWRRRDKETSRLLSNILTLNPKDCNNQFCSVTQSCPTLYDPMNLSTPGLPVHHQLPEFTQTQVYRVGDAIQPSYPLLSPSPPAPNPSQHQGLFQWVNSSHELKVLKFQLQHQSFQ